LQALARVGGQQLVVGVDLDDLGTLVRRLPVSAGQQDLAVQLLHAPAIAGEAGRQVIEQLGVGGLGAGTTEVLHRVHNALVKVLGPHTVGVDTRGQRVAFAAQPVGQG